MKTVAIYQQTESGLSRLGVFTPRRYYSVRSISEQFCYRHPNIEPESLFIARRIQLMGQVTDDAERIPFDCGRYQVEWDNGHASGTFSEVFRSERMAEDWARNWKREMVAYEPTEKERRNAREAYSYEVIEVEPEDELDPEAAPDNPRPEWS